jgi:hypothetical protein
VAAWNRCPFVHFVELDFIPGVFIAEAVDTAPPRSMWVGFACAVLCSENRVGRLVIQKSQRGFHEAVKKAWRYRFDGPAPLKRHLLRVIETLHQLRASECAGELQPGDVHVDEPVLIGGPHLILETAGDLSGRIETVAGAGSAC